jgi:hypothetical protein
MHSFWFFFGQANRYWRIVFRRISVFSFSKYYPV